MRFLTAALLLLLCASCTNLGLVIPSQPLPTVGYRYLELVADDRFDQAGDWRSYDDGAGLFLGPVEGVYRISFVGRQYVWTQAESLYGDQVIEADARQVSDFDYNAFGLACRLDPANSGRGYFFLISGDGSASIRWSNGRSLEAIVAAAPKRQIKQGRAQNRIRIVCIDDYLALWVNDQFVAEARDGRSTGGAVGLVAVMNYAGEKLEVEFDDLRIWRAALDGRKR